MNLFIHFSDYFLTDFNEIYTVRNARDAFHRMTTLTDTSEAIIIIKLQKLRITDEIKLNTVRSYSPFINRYQSHRLCNLYNL